MRWMQRPSALRGTGDGARETASGSKRILTGRTVTVDLEGGDLVIEWRASDDRVLMTGPVELERVGDLLSG